MALKTQGSRLWNWGLSRGRRQRTRCLAAVAVTAASLLGTAVPSVAATLPTLTVVVLGSGGVTSRPAGIACPARCTATFAAGTRVVLTPVPKSGSAFLRWGGSCTGTGACTVAVSALAAVAAQFTAGPKPTPQPITGKAVAVPGSYTGNYLGEYGSLTFFVSPGGTSLLNVSVPNVVMTCTPAGSFPGSVNLSILDTAIGRNGSFTATGTQQGVFAGAPARFRYFLAGRFQGSTAAGPATAKGTLSEEISFSASGATERCASNTQSWSVTHDPQTAQKVLVAVPGSYSGRYLGEYGSLSFFVSPGGANLLSVSVPNVSIACTPTGSFPGSVNLSILGTPIKPNGSFVATGTQSGVFDNASTRFTYLFAGYFEGATPAGPVTVAGTLREDVTFAASGTTEACTSNDLWWSVTRS